jgi:dTDP-glucose 4,6-dehydratase
LKETYGDRYVFVRSDICDYAQVSAAIESYDIDTIVNFAAESHVDRSLMNPDSFLNTNIYGTYTLLRAARHYRILRYHQVSTDEVYGQVIRGSFGEEDPLETRSPYSASKAAAGLLVHAYFNSFGVPATITRGSNNIGPYQYPEKVVPLFIINALDDKPLPVYGDGLYVRDYQYVLDHCRGIDLVLHRGAPGEIYNLGSGNEMAALDLARTLLDKLGKPQSLIYLVADRPGQDRRYSLNCAKIKALGWTPQWELDRSLDDTIEWYVENEWWWRKLMGAEYWQFYDRQYRERLAHAVPVHADPELN